MKILVVTATTQELGNLQQMNLLKRSYPELEFLVTGVGMVKATHSLTSMIHLQKPDFVLHAGICGSFRAEFSPGTLVHVMSEEFSEMGYDDRGKFVPFSQTENFETIGKLFNTTDWGAAFGLPSVHGITVNTVNGHTPTIHRVAEQFHPDVESMEGGAVFYACLQANLPFCEIRAVSNYVEPRNTKQWNIPLAIKNLNTILPEILQIISQK